MKLITLVFGMVVIAAVAANPQSSRPQFDVSAIKPTDPSFRGNLIGAPGGILSARGYTLKALIAYSYDMDERQIVDVPKSLDSERYDITAKPQKAGRFTPAEGKLMLNHCSLIAFNSSSIAKPESCRCMFLQLRRADQKCGHAPKGMVVHLAACCFRAQDYRAGIYLSRISQVGCKRWLWTGPSLIELVSPENLISI
jgi:hypothetical protein